MLFRSGLKNLITCILAIFGLACMALAQQPKIYIQTGQPIDQLDISKDGRFILTSKDIETKLWDVDSGRELWTFRGTCGRFSPTQPVLITGLGSKGITLWNMATAAAIKTFRGHQDTVLDMAFFPDGRRFVSVSGDSTVRIWDLSKEGSGSLISHPLADGNYFSNVAVSPNGNLFAAGATNGKITVWDSKSGKEITTFDAHTNRVSSIAFSPDGRSVISAGGYKMVNVWNVESKKKTAEFSGDDQIISAVFSPDGRSVAFDNAFSHDIHIRDIASGSEFKLKGHQSWVRSLNYVAQGQLVSASNDGTIRFWDLEKKAEIKRLEGTSVEISHNVSLSANNRYLLNQARDILHIWDLQKSALLRILGESGKFSPDSLSLVTADADSAKPGKIELWDLATGTRIASVAAHSDDVTRFSFTTKYLVTSSSDKTVRVSDPRTLKEVFTFKGHAGEVPFAMLSWDDKFVGSFDVSNEILVWEPETGKVRFRFHHPDGTFGIFPDKVDSLLFSPDGKYLLSKSKLKLVAWDLANGNKSEERDISQVMKMTYDELSLSNRMDRSVRQFDVKSNDSRVLFKRETQHKLGVYDAKTYKFSEEGNVPFMTLIALDQDEWAVITSDGLMTKY